ncbi:unnamed protein product [Pedinophyceae sp. YPF-701]|nr:unnamed protein product [Pedinophyceae sp. YPF-701]
MFHPSGDLLSVRANEVWLTLYGPLVGKPKKEKRAPAPKKKGFWTYAQASVRLPPYGIKKPGIPAYGPTLADGGGGGTSGRGGGGGGGGGGGDKGGAGEGGFNKGKLLSLLAYVLGAAMVTGGAVGWMKKGSKMSLYAGSTLGIALLYSAVVLPSKVGGAVAFLACAALAGFFIPRWQKTQKEMHAALGATGAVCALAFLTVFF